MRRLIWISMAVLIFALWGAGAWFHRRDKLGAQQIQADMLAQGLDAFRRREGRLPCPSSNEDGREDCGGEGVMMSGRIPWRALDMRRSTVNASLRLRVPRVYTQSHVLDRLPVDGLCRSGLYPDIALGEEMAAQLLPEGSEKPLVVLRRWQLRPRTEGTTAPHLYAEAERREDRLYLRWGTLCGANWYAQRESSFGLPRPWPGRHAVEWSASRQGQRGVFFEPGVAHPLFVERTGTQWKAIDLLPKEALESFLPRQMNWSADGRWLATITEEGEARLWDCRSLPCGRSEFGLPEQLIPAAAEPIALDFAGGDTLAYISGTAPYLMLAQRRNDRWEWLPTAAWKLAKAPRSVRMSTDGHRAILEFIGRIEVLSWTSQPEHIGRSIAPLAEDTVAFAFSPDGHWLAIRQANRILFLAREGGRWTVRDSQKAEMLGKPLSLQWKDNRSVLLLGLESQTEFHPPAF